MYMYMYINTLLAIFICMCTCVLIGSSTVVKTEADDGSSSTPVTEPPKHMGENVHVFECLQDFDTMVASKVLQYTALS